MTQSEGTPERLPPEVGFQAKREDLLRGLRQLEEKGKVNSLNSSVIVAPGVYFIESGEIFELDLIKHQYEDRSRAIKSECSVRISPLKTITVNIIGSSGSSQVSESYRRSRHYHPPISFNILKEDEAGNLSGLSAKPVASIEELDQLIDIVSFINNSIAINSTDENPIEDIPNAVKVLAERIREAKIMKFEYKKPEFYDELRKVRQKAIRLDSIDRSGYERRESVVVATTGWVKVEEDREKFELKFETVDQFLNGDYTQVDEVSRREIGDKSEGRRLFDETQLWSITFNPIEDEEQLQECIDILRLLDKNISAVVSASS